MMVLNNTAIATIIATIFSTLVTIIISIIVNKRDKLQNLDNQLDSILKIAVEYPYLESPAFTKTWKENCKNSTEAYRRYEAYATLVFNYLSRVSAFFKYDMKKINGYIDIKGWVKIHQTYWFSPSESNENEQVYDEKFKKIIHTILGELPR